jgi:DNA polymerase-3 subunit epsilon
LDTGKAKIVSISIIKIMPNGERIGKSTLVNPQIPIPKESTEIHGIKDSDVADKPTFRNIYKKIYEFMSDSDLAGFNNNSYDNQVLAEEFMRCGIEFPTVETKSIDACLIFRQMEKRTLSAAMKFYCGVDNFEEKAHDSKADTEAVIDVLSAMIEKYDELKDKDVDFLSNFTNQDGNVNRVDLAGRIIKNEAGEYVWNFGKSKGQKVKDNLGFGSWILNNDFPETFKNIVRKVLTEIDKKSGELF